MGFIKDLKQKMFPDNFGDTYIDENDEDIIAQGDDGYDSGVSETYSREVSRSYSQQMPRAGVVASNSSALEMKVVSPTKYEAVTQIADILLDRKTVLLNLENTNKETAKRLIDFLSGAAYALGGDIQKVADNTFAVTPNNVAVSNESIDADYSADVDEGKYE